jgi:predicted metal-dependent peptidase
MGESYSVCQRAEGKIRIATQRLVAKYPFHASILERCISTAGSDVGTMGVTVSGSDILLVHNPTFVLNIPMDELGGVLLHEVHHVILGHLLASPHDFPDHWARTMAEELTVNEFIREPLPDGAVTLAQFPKLPPMESTGQRYNRLRKVRRRQPLGTPHGAPNPPTSHPADSKGAQNPEKGKDASSPIHRKPCSGFGDCQNGDIAGSTDRSLRRGQRTVDDHTLWAEARQKPDQSRIVIRDLIQEAALEVGHDQIPPELHHVLSICGVGKDAGQSCQELEQGRRGRMNWRWLLRHHVGRLLEAGPVFTRPPRRFPHLIGIFPAQRRQAARPLILAVVDTSKSITNRLLEQINGELTRLARSFRVKVVECDTKIQRVFEYRPLKHVLGRGGTDLRPPLRRRFLRQHRPDVVVFFTDGDGPVPAHPPGLPVIWCLTPEGKRPAPWGRCLRMDPIG